MANYIDVEKIYNSIKKRGIKEHLSPEMPILFSSLAKTCFEYLSSCAQITLVSKVIGKEYFCFQKSNKISRAIRKSLFTVDSTLIDRFLSCLHQNDFKSLSTEEIDKACYTIAISFCAIVDLEKTGDQKTPGTFFEFFIGYCFAKKFNINPIREVEVLNLDKKSKLPTDLLFDMGSGKAKFHVPIKISTRERVIQVWAHQRVLDGVYGTGRFFGMLTCLSETKVDSKKREVTEICLPLQWQLYQMFIAQMKRVYYLDLPLPYATLNDVFPKIHVSTFSAFLTETDFDKFE